MISTRDKFYEDNSMKCTLNGKQILYKITFDEEDPMHCTLDGNHISYKIDEEDSMQCVLNGKRILYRITFDDGFLENDVRIKGIRIIMVKGEKGDTGTTNYEELENKPTLNGETIIGDKTSADYHFHAVATSGLIDDLSQENDFIIYCGTATEVV